MVVAGHWNFIIVRCLASTEIVMIVTIYKIETATEHKSQVSFYAPLVSSDSAVYYTAVEARKFYNWQCKRLKHKDVPWKSVTLSRITFKGTPRQIACWAYTQQEFTSETLQVQERIMV